MFQEFKDKTPLAKLMIIIIFLVLVCQVLILFKANTCETLNVHNLDRLEIRDSKDLKLEVKRTGLVDINNGFFTATNASRPMIDIKEIKDKAEDK